MKQLSLFLVISFVIFFGSALISGCGCGDDDDDDNDTLSDDDDDDTVDDDDDTVDDDDDDDSDDDDDFQNEYPPDEGQWVGDIFFQQIDGGSPGDSGTSIALGSDNTRYIVAESGGIVYLYTCDENVKCTREVVDRFAMSPSMAMDNEGDLHVCYAYIIQNDDYDLYYATNKTGNWDVTMLDDENNAGSYCDIAFDSGDQSLHVAYEDTTNLDLRYATNKSGAWVSETIVDYGDLGAYNDIEIDSGGNVHISTMYGGGELSNAVAYVTNKDGAWNYEFMCGPASGGTIALASDDSVHGACIFKTGYPWEPVRTLAYVKKGALIWQTDWIDTSGDLGWDTYIILDENDAVHISYFSGLNITEQLNYITNASGSWEKIAVSSEDGEGWKSSLTFDLNKYPVIAHHNNDYRSLKLTEVEELTYSTSTIEQGAFFNGYLDIKCDQYNIPHMAYKTHSFVNTLKIAERDGSNWDIEPIISGDLNGLKPTIDIDNNGNQFITYFGINEYDDQILSFTTRTSQDEPWVTETLDGNLCNTFRAAGFDPDGVFHVFYCRFDGFFHRSWSEGLWDQESISLEPGAGKTVYFIDNEIQILHGSPSGLIKSVWNTNWQSETINSGNTDAPSSVIDSLGNYHGIFTINSEDDLYYVTNTSGSWEIEIINNNFDNPMM